MWLGMTCWRKQRVERCPISYTTDTVARGRCFREAQATRRLIIITKRMVPCSRPLPLRQTQLCFIVASNVIQHWGCTICAQDITIRAMGGLIREIHFLGTMKTHKVYINIYMLAVTR